MTRVLLGVFLGVLLLACEDSSTSSGGGIAPPIEDNNNNNENINENVVAGAPDAPTNVQVTVGDRSMTVSWDAPTEVTGTASVNETHADETPAEVTEYVVYYSEKNITNKKSSDVTKLTTEETSVTITELTNDIEYYVLVTARNAKGEGRASSVKRATPKIPEVAARIDIGRYVLRYGNWSVNEGTVATVSPTWVGLPVRENKLTYTITGRPEKATAGHVTIDSSTGVITSTADIGYSDGGDYTVSVQGWEEYSGNNMATLTITITGLDVSQFTATISTLAVTEGKVASSDAPVWEGTGAPDAGDRTAVRYFLARSDGRAINKDHISINSETGVISTTAGVDGNDAGLYQITASGTGNYTGTIDIPFTLAVAIDLKNYALSYSEQIIKATLSFTGITISPTRFSQSPRWGAAYNSIGAPATKEGSVKYAITQRTPSNGTQKVKIDPNTGVISASGLATDDFTASTRTVEYTITVTPVGTEHYVGTKTAKFTLRLVQ